MTGFGLASATSLVPTISPHLSLQSTIDATVNNLVNPITYQYNLGVERQLPANMFVAIRYVGARSNKLFSTQRYNYFSGNTGARSNPAYGAIDAIGNYGDSNYNSLQIEGSNLFSHGFQIRGNYTYSKDLDDVSEIFATFAAPTALAAILHRGNSGRTMVTLHMTTPLPGHLLRMVARRVSCKQYLYKCCSWSVHQALDAVWHRDLSVRTLQHLQHLC